MARVGRRKFLAGTGAFSGALLAGGFRRVIAEPSFSDDPFSLGVASGDPLPTSVVLWTRLAPKPLQLEPVYPADIPVRWQIATDPDMRQVVQQGVAIAQPETGHSVHVEVKGLRDNATYWYRFAAGNRVSPVGRTRTTPALDVTPERLSFAFVSCQDFERGYFTPYRHIAADEELSFILHLGDYIYEYPPQTNSNPPRRHLGAEPTDLASYRRRYAQYHTDPDLQAARATHPLIPLWDDHEVENDYAGVHSEDYAPVAEFQQRRAAAYQAYYEHMPLRSAARVRDGQLQLYRRFDCGTLVRFHLLDTRQYRSDQACQTPEEGGGRPIACAERLDPTRSLLGQEQEQWLFAGLEQSSARWNAIAQPYLVGELRQVENGEVRYWSDGWDGYPVSRQRLLEFVKTRQIANPVFLGGDIHSFWVGDLKPDFQTEGPAVATEFVTTSISARGVPYELFASFLPDNPHIQFFESRWRGYTRCAVAPDRWRTDLMAVDTVEQPRSPARVLASFEVKRDRPGAVRV